MDLNSFALSILLGFSALLGVEATPSNLGGWQQVHDWRSEGNMIAITASHSSPSSLCENINGFIHLPLLIHGTHKLYLDNTLIAQFGDPSFAKASSFYNQAFVPCLEILKLDGKTLHWQAHSYSKYFAQFNFYPKYVASLPDYYVLTQPLTLIASSIGLLLIGVFTLIIFYKIFPRYLVLFCTGILGWSVFFISMSAGGNLFNLSMLHAHKIADAGLWIGNTALLACFYLEGRLSQRLLRAHLVMIALSLVVITFGSTGNVVQFGTNLGFPTTILCTIYILLSTLKNLNHTSNKPSNTVFLLIAVFAFTTSIFHDILLTAGVINGGLFLPVGIFAAFFALALLIGQRMNAINEENRLLNNSLSQEVRRQLELMVEQDRQTQKAQAARLQWLEFMATFLRHELKNSIAGIMTSLQLAAKTPAKSEKYIERATSSANNIKSLLAAVTDANSVESMIANAKLEEVDLSNVIQERSDELSLIYSDRNISTEISPSARIWGNTQLIELILDKIVNNAVEHSKPDSDINIMISNSPDGIVLSISNKGPSLPQNISSIFALSFSTKVHTGENFGIGLYLVKLITDFHRADISAHNIPDGVQFKIFFKDILSEYRHQK